MNMTLIPFEAAAISSHYTPRLLALNFNNQKKVDLAGKVQHLHQHKLTRTQPFKLIKEAIDTAHASTAYLHIRMTIPSWLRIFKNRCIAVNR